MPWGRLILLFVAGWLAVLLNSHAALAQTLGGMALRTCVAPVRAGDASGTMLAAPRGRFDCRREQTRFGPGDYWVLADVPPPRSAADAPNIVRFASLWQERADVWIRYGDGKTAAVALDGPGISQHLQLGAMIEVHPRDVHVRATRVLWRITGSGNMRAIVVGAQVATGRGAAQSDVVLGAMYAAFGGLCIALLAYNLALWAALRHRFQLTYCVMVATLMAYSLSTSGVLAWLLPWMPNNDRLRLNYLLLAIAASAALFFARHFFEARVFAGWPRRVANRVFALLMGVSLTIVTVTPFAPWLIRPLDFAYSISFLMLIAVVVPVLWRAWRLRSNYLWLFALAWGAPILLALARIASSLDLVRWNIWLDNSTILSMSLEALLSSLAIAYRIRLLSRERDEAREQEIAARLLADTDPLTGLLNRRAFLREAIGRAGEQTLILADVDHFKLVNDTLGHDGGDEVLRAIARALRQVAPPAGLVARLGGEEFAILAPRGVLSTDDLLDRVRTTRMPFDLSVTVSLGCCTGPLTSEPDWKALYRRADLALFEAKAAGRDRARDAEPLPLPLAA